MNELLGSRIKELRIEHGLTAAELAEIIGIKEETYNSIEGGRKGISYLILYDIAYALGISVYDITSVLEERYYPSGEVFDMLDLFYANKHMYDRLQN